MILTNRFFILKFFIIYFLFLLINDIRGQEKYFFEKISVSDGLSNSVVLCTYQDHLGYLWIGTLDGLNRYDGYDIKVYKNIPADSTSLPYNIISSISEDKDGNLLVGTIDQASKYNRATDSFTHFLIDKGAQTNSSRIMNFLKDSKDRLWISTNQTGVQLFDESTNRYKGINFRDYSGNEISFSNSDLILKVIELKNGNILTASRTHGIFIYNSYKNEFQSYFSNSKLNLKGIHAIFEDSSGKLWFGGKDEIFTYNPVTYKLKTLNISARFPEQNTNNYYGGFYEESSKQILMISNFGILETDLKGNKFSLITENIPNLNPINFYRDNFGIYWISTSGNGLIRFDPAKKPFQFFNISDVGQSEIKSNPVTGVIQNPLRKNELILSLRTQGIFTFDRETYKFNKIQNNPGANLLPDDNGNLWYTREWNLKKFDLKSGRTENFAFQNPSYTRTFNVRNLKFGPNKNIWIADRQGVQIFNPVSKIFKRLPSITNKPVSPELLSEIRDIVNDGKPVASLLKISEGASLTKEFIFEKPAKILIVNLGEGRQTSLIGSMFDYGWLENSNGKRLWSADKIQNTFNDGGGYKNRIAFGCLNLPKGKYKINFVSDIGHNYGSYNVPAPPDSEWYGIQVLQLDDQQFSYLDEKIKSELDNTHYPHFEGVSYIEFSRKYINTAWLAATWTGLIRYNMRDNTYNYYHFDDGTQRWSLVNQLGQILEDKDGIIWVTTNAGLIKFNPETEKFQLITQSDGLASNYVATMIEDQNGNLWFGTPGGISMLDKKNPSNQLNFINYDNTDGINDLPLNKSITMTDDGEIFYGGYGGLNAFYPGSANNTLPKPVITSINISGVPVEKLVSEVNYRTNISETRQIELSFTDNNLSFEFASIHFSRPAKNKLAYMLEGIDKNWNYTNRRFASYLNLPPGEYIFRLKGSNGYGVWNPEAAAISIIIYPPWWRTTFAYVGYAIIFVFGVLGVDRFQRKRLLKRARETARIREAELRAKLAESENDRKTKELEEARELQLSMLPKDLPILPNLDIAVFMQTATEVGGDYYDFHVGMDGTLTVVVGDATGHGMKAGTMVTTTKSLFNILAPNPDILATFSEISRVIKGMKFHQLSMCLMLLKIKGNELFVSSAAMPPALIYRKKNKAIEEIFMKGMPLGVMNNFPYTLKEIHLQQGDTILLLSDGLPELTNNSNEMYGYDRTKTEFHSVGEKEPEKIVEHLKNSASQWANGKSPDDDVTFVVIKVK